MNPPDQPTPARPITSLNAEEAERLVDQMWKSTPDLAPTPRIDSEANYCDATPVMPWVDADFARTLERELSAALRRDELSRKELNIFKHGWKEDQAELARLRAEKDECANNAFEQMNARHAADERAAAAIARAESAEAELARVADLYKCELHRADGAEAELKVSENWVEHHSKHADDLIGENVSIRAERDALAKDKVRLESALSHGWTVNKCDGGKWSVYDYEGCRITDYHDTERDAIDAAMKGTP